MKKFSKLFACLSLISFTSLCLFVGTPAFARKAVCCDPVVKETKKVETKKVTVAKPVKSDCEELLAEKNQEIQELQAQLETARRESAQLKAEINKRDELIDEYEAYYKKSSSSSTNTKSSAVTKKIETKTETKKEVKYHAGAW